MTNQLQAIVNQSNSSQIEAPRIQFDHAVNGATQDEPTHIRITHIVTPSLTNIITPTGRPLTADEVQAKKEDAKTLQAITNFQKTLQELSTAKGATFSNAIQNGIIAELKNINPRDLILSQEGIESVDASKAILQELINNNYTTDTALNYAESVCSLLFNHLNGGALLEQAKVDALYKKVLTESTITLHSRSQEQTNNPSFSIKDNQTGAPIALLKQQKNEYDSSHMRLIKNFPIYHTPTRQLVGSESDALLGLNRTPITCRVTCLNTINNAPYEKEGVLQIFIPHAKTFGSDLIYQEGGGQFLQTLENSQAHMSAISGILKGHAAGHIDNYVVVEDMTSHRAKAIHEIDLKECMTPFNVKPDAHQVNRFGDGEEYCEDLNKKLNDLKNEIAALNQKPHTRKIKSQKELKEKELSEVKKRLENEKKSIIMARMSVLGLPQNNRPFDKAALLFLTHPSLAKMMDAHHKNIRRQNYEIQPSTLKAQRERLEMLTDLAKRELAKNAITATPRDAYFHIFGGKELFNIATSKNYHPISAFNNIVGCAYRHVFKDLSRPETIPERPADRAASDSEEARIVFANLQALR